MIILLVPVSIMAAVLFLPGGLHWWPGAVAFLVLMLGLFYRWRIQNQAVYRVALPIALLLFGVQWGLLANDRFQPLALEEGRDYYLEATVTDIPRQFYQQTQAQMIIHCLGSAPGQCDIVNERIPLWRLNGDVAASKQWQVHPGQTWRLVVNTKQAKPPTWPSNFRLSRWLKGRHVVARLKMNADHAPSLLADGTWQVDSARASINAYFKQRQEQQPSQALSSYPIIMALISGDRSLMTDQHWQIFNRTGTTHLMAISGLHVGLVAMFVMAIFTRPLKRWLWFTHRYPAVNGSALIALIVCTGYGALAGFALPTQRALVMLAVYVLLKWLGRSRQIWFGLSIAFLLVLLWDPMACLSVGFWFSFVAVFFILWMVAGTLERQSVVGRWLWIQLGLFFALAPILLWQMQGVSLASPVTNLVAIPVVGFVLVPLVLVWGCCWWLLGDVATPLLELSAWVADGVLFGLQYAGNWDYSFYQIGVQTAWAMLIAYVGVVWLMTAGLPGRWMSPLLFLPLLWPSVHHHGLYVVGGSAPQILMVTPQKVLMLSASVWPKLIPKWQQRWLQHWGVGVAADVSFHNVAHAWQGRGLFLAEFHLDQGALGRPMVSQVKYHSLCRGDSLSYSRYQIEPLVDSRYPNHCAVKIQQQDGASWLIWPSSSKRSQRFLVSQQGKQEVIAPNLLEEGDRLILFPAKSQTIEPKLLQLASDHQADILALKPLPSATQKQLQQLPLNANRLPPANYIHFPLHGGELFKEIPK